MTETETDRPGTEEAGLPFRYSSALAAQIEPRWQDTWEAEGTFHTPNPVGPLAGDVAGREKFFLMDFFPYPSGEGLHVGHPLGYIATDVLGRFKRMCGVNVLYTMGFDAFGLPAEQYAVQTGQHPRLTTERNIIRFRQQLRRLGLAHDRRRSIETIDPDYYRWTQWIFLQIFNSWYDPDADGGRGRPGRSASWSRASSPGRDRRRMAGRGRSSTTSSNERSSTSTGWRMCPRRR